MIQSVYLLQVGSSNYSALPLLSVAIVPQCVTWLLSFVYASLPLLATSWPSLARLWVCDHYLCLPTPWAECCSTGTPGRSVERGRAVCSKHLPTQGHHVQGGLYKFKGRHSGKCESRPEYICVHWHKPFSVIGGGVEPIRVGHADASADAHRMRINAHRCASSAYCAKNDIPIFTYKLPINCSPYHTAPHAVFVP